MVANKPGAPGRSRSSRSNRRAGKAGCFRLHLWYLPPAFFEQAGHGRQPTPGLPCALCSRRAIEVQQLGRYAPRGVEAMADAESTVICTGMKGPAAIGSAGISPAAATPPLSSRAQAGDPVRRGLSAEPLPSRRTRAPGPFFACGFDAATGTQGALELQRRRQAERRHRGWATASRPNPSAPLAKSPRHGYIAPARLRRASGTNISPGPYRSFRELSLARSVDLDIWCPPTFVGNSGIERFNGDCGFALVSLLFVSLLCPFDCRPAAFLRTLECPRPRALDGGPAACR